MMDDGGGFPLEIQAKQVAENAMRYGGSLPCTSCGVIMNPVEAMYSKGNCVKCYTQIQAKRAKNRMVG